MNDSSCPSKLFFLRPLPKLHLGRFFTNDGGMGGLADRLRSGWTGVKDDIEDDETSEWMSPRRVSCAEGVEAEKNGNEPPEAWRVGDMDGDLWAVGYSNLKEGSNGVPTIWVDGGPSRLEMSGARRRMEMEGEEVCLYFGSMEGEEVMTCGPTPENCSSWIPNLIVLPKEELHRHLWRIAKHGRWRAGRDEWFCKTKYLFIWRRSSLVS